MLTEVSQTEKNKFYIFRFINKYVVMKYLGCFIVLQQRKKNKGKRDLPDKCGKIC